MFIIRKFFRLPLCHVDSYPKLAEFIALMKSEAIFLILSQLTGLNLHSTAGNGPGGDERFLEVSDSPSASRERTPGLIAKKDDMIMNLIVKNLRPLQNEQPVQSWC